MISPLYTTLRQALVPRYGRQEAQAMALMVFEDVFGVSVVDVYADKVRHFSEEEIKRLENISMRLQAGEPLQYVTGSARFCDLTFRVTPATLIPRPETEWLVDHAAAFLHQSDVQTPSRVLDAGTGSGCIAVALAKRCQWLQVEAWDLSAEALEVAADNAQRHGVEVDFRCRDMLLPCHAASTFDLIVSNPPYVKESEKADMAAHVLDHEPATALFVPDDDALCFYRALARLACTGLRPGGGLMVEANTALTSDTAALFVAEGLTDVAVSDDCFGRPRFVTARKPS